MSREQGISAQIVMLLAQGLSDSEVAARTGRSTKQVDTTRRRSLGYEAPSATASKAACAAKERARIALMALTPDRIPLTLGKAAVIDSADFEVVCHYNWIAHFERGIWYAVASARVGDNKHIKMHRLICGAPDGTLVDHRDGDGLNNRRSNLRRATSQQNGFNKGGYSTGTTYKGIYFYRATGQWTGQVTGIDGRRVSIGYHDNQRDAALERDRVAVRLQGEFARLNFPALFCGAVR